MVEEETSNAIPSDEVADVDQASFGAEMSVENGKADDKDVDSDDGLINYKEKYRNLKRKLKCLLFEQECFHEELRKVQRKCLRVNRDKSFLLDHLLKYEEPEMSSTDDDMTESSENEEDAKPAKPQIKKKRARPKNATKGNDVKAKNILMAGDKVRCRRMENGKQCSKLVSIKVKSGICYAHRQQLSNEKQQASSPIKSPKSTTPKPSEQRKGQPPKGGKDIGQIREAMEASSRISTSSPGLLGEEDDELVIDLPV